MTDARQSYAVLMPLAPWESAHVLSEALASLAAQSLRPAQLVVSCDGEPPAALMAVLKSSLLAPELVHGSGGEGVGPVLARGLLACRHDLVVRADADDLSLPQRCAFQVAWMAAHPDVMAFSSWIEEFSDGSERPHFRRVPCDPHRIASAAKRRNPLNHPAVILRREAVLAVGNYRSCPGFEDYDLWLRLLQRWGPHALANSPQALVKARVGEAHLARRHGWGYARAELAFFRVAAKQGLISWCDALLALAFRVPLRLLPSPLLAWVMQRTTRVRRRDHG